MKQWQAGSTVIGSRRHCINGNDEKARKIAGQEKSQAVLRRRKQEFRKEEGREGEGETGERV